MRTSVHLVLAILAMTVAISMAQWGDIMKELSDAEAAYEKGDTSTAFADISKVVQDPTVIQTAKTVATNPTVLEELEKLESEIKF